MPMPLAMAWFQRLTEPAESTMSRRSITVQQIMQGGGVPFVRGSQHDGVLQQGLEREFPARGERGFSAYASVIAALGEGMERNTGRGDKTGAQRASVFIRIRHIDQADTVDARLLWLLQAGTNARWGLLQDHDLDLRTLLAEPLDDARKQRDVEDRVHIDL